MYSSGSTREIKPVKIFMFRNLLQGIGLCSSGTWLGKFTIGAHCQERQTETWKNEKKLLPMGRIAFSRKTKSFHPFS